VKAAKTPTETTLPSWLHVGAEVGTYAGSDAPNPCEAVVERFTKTQVVLDNGGRFPLRGVGPEATRLSRHEGGEWGWNVYLVPRDHVGYRGAVAQQERQARRAAAVRAVEKWRRLSTAETARDAIDALQATIGDPA
jgi:hypothetical protein